MSLVPPVPKLSQGDLFTDVPWSIIDTFDWIQSAGTGTTRDLNDPRKRYVETPAPAVGARHNIVARAGRASAILISHSCVSDKDSTRHLTFARVLGMHAQSKEQDREAIRTGENKETFHLTPVQGILAEESYVDLRYTTTVDRRLVLACVRVGSLTLEARRALQLRLILYWTRREAPEGFPEVETE